jgi:hypothetical protein
MKNAVTWDVTPRGSCKKRRSSETPVLIRATQRNIPVDGIFNNLFISLKEMFTGFRGILHFHPFNTSAPLAECVK